MVGEKIKVNDGALDAGKSVERLVSKRRCRRATVVGEVVRIRGRASQATRLLRAGEVVIEIMASEVRM